MMALSFVVIVGNYMNVFGAFRNWLLFVGLALQSVGWLGLIAGLVLFLTVRRPAR